MDSDEEDYDDDDYGSQFGAVSRASSVFGADQLSPSRKQSVFGSKGGGEVGSPSHHSKSSSHKSLEHLKPRGEPRPALGLSSKRHRRLGVTLHNQSLVS